MAAWTIEIGGTSRSYRKITFKRSLDSAPTNFDATIEYSDDIDYWDIVEIINGTTTEWYGYIEKKNTKWDENGRYMVVGGRCRKAILWKKWNERFSDTRINGFFGSVKASELLKFLIRCPVSDSPVDVNGDPILNHKIGWGIKPSDLVMRASPTASDTDPIWTKLRYIGLAWRNRGTPHNGVVLDVDSWTAGSTPWTKTGASPYLHDAGGEPENANKIDTVTVGATDDFGFDNLPSGATGVNSFKLGFYLKTNSPWTPYQRAAIDIYVWRQSDSTWVWLAGLSVLQPTWKKFTIDAISAVNTVSDVNNVKVRFEFIGTSWLVDLPCHITQAWFDADYSTGGSQGVGDYFVVDTGTSDDVMGILIESRKSPSQYARNYDIEYSNADDPDPTVDGDWTDFPTAISITGNQYRDILHSWRPTTLQHIRIKITDDSYVFDTVNLKIEARLVSGSSVTPQYALYDGIGWSSFANFAEFTESTYETKSKDVTSFLSTTAKLNAARFRVQTTVGADEIRITHVYLELVKDGNVITTMDVDAWVNLTNEWTKTGADPYINASDGDINCITSVDDADGEEDQYYTFEDSTINNAWEISQIYVFKAEPLKYRVVLDGESEPAAPPPYLGGPYLGTINPDSNFDTSIENLNLPFGRLIDTIETISKRLHSSYIPFEWWIDMSDGDIEFSDQKGSDKSETISFVKGTNLGSATKEDDASKTIQRVKIIGKSEGKKQDNISSDWQVDTSEMDNVKTFYEEIVSKKVVDNKDIADLLANIYVTENSPPEEMITCIVNNDPYAAMAYDVGDDVTITDSLTGVSGAHRIHTIKKVIDKNGCIVTLYLDATYQDVESEWARIHKKFRQLELTGTVVEDWFAEGSSQGKQSSTKSLTNVFEAEAKNDTEDAGTDKNDEKWTISGEADGASLDIGEGWMSMTGCNNVTQRTVDGYINNRTLHLDQNPKMVFEFKIIEDGSFNAWENGDVFSVWIGTFQLNPEGIGFRIFRDSGVYKFYVLLRDEVGIKVIIIKNVAANTKYRFEAVMDFESKVALYYLQDASVPSTVELSLVALLELSDAFVPENYELVPLYITMTTDKAIAGNPSKIYIYKFKSEWEARQ